MAPEQSCARSRQMRCASKGCKIGNAWQEAQSRGVPGNEPSRNARPAEVNAQRDTYDAGNSQTQNE